ncbi:MAG: DUF459 domain-containing protein [Nitratireductor sp.]|nr:DUF459 domain-containing protein [Nitratireductor sp.]
MIRRLALAIVLIALAGFVVPDFSPVHFDTAYAQDSRPKRKNLLELLFGRMKKNAERARKQIFKSPSSSRKKSSDDRSRDVRTRAKSVTVPRSSAAGAAVATSAAASAPDAVEKNEDAAKVLVVGDFMAGSLADGLDGIFAQNPSIVVVDEASGLSGLVRDDVVDWPAKTASLIEEQKPVAVVVLVGMNDRQQLRTGGAKYDKLSDGWRKEYISRVAKLARTVREKRLPLIWVGLPPVSKGSMNSDYLVFNEIYETQTEAVGGSFVDVWKGFVDEDGGYVRSGPNVNGQIVTLRRADGINMTDQGEAKLAYYTEKIVKRLTGFGREALFSSLGSLGDAAAIQEPQYDPAGTGKTVVIALGSPAADGGSQLEGGEGFLTDADARLSNGFELVARGQSSEPKSGRIDADWGKPAFELANGQTPEPVLANMRGMNFKSAFENGFPPAGSEGAGGEGETPAAN